MTYTYNNKGTCSVRTVVELNDDHTIKSVQVLGGCDGMSSRQAAQWSCWRTPAFTTVWSWRAS